ncbi:MAG: D-tyrosyl-tRNA(Tyr) deacylase [Gammaproteobacteria bacterium]|nr:D-tyrosyl-tRNA(Tyr) deacylase [Gammaproteobacteria bacterium]
MIALIQRVTHAYVDIDAVRVAEIDSGLMVLVGVQKGDAKAQADRMLERLLGYRVFADDEDKMNLSLRDIGAGLLLVPQFTLAADTQKGSRPSFSSAASPDEARRLFEYIVEQAKKTYKMVQAGRFGANMQVGLINDGPVTFQLEVKPGT